MLKFYVYKKIDGLQHIPLLNYFWGKGSFGVKRYGDNALSLFNRQFFNLVEDPNEADYFLIPHNFFYIKDDEFIQHFIELSKKLNKKIIIFSYGDSDTEINVPNCIIFRSSQYLYKKNSNELIMPAIADDLLEDGKVVAKKKEIIPVVGFCGWANYGNFSRIIIENLKLTCIYIKSLIFSKNLLFHKRGLIFRIQALKVLSKSSLVKSNFIVRSSFSGNEKTIRMDANLARQEYIQNILDSDVSLAIKGDGNFSIRFYEILSLARIPLLLDTSSPLPLEDVIDYQDFVLRVPVSDIKNLPEIVAAFYENLTQEDFDLKQKKARNAFERYLRADKYFDYVLSSDFLKRYD